MQQKHIIQELENQFSHQEVMCALDICYPQYWFIDTFEATYPGYIATLESFSGTLNKLWVLMDVEEWVPSYLNFLKHLITFAIFLAIPCGELGLLQAHSKCLKL